jgi:Tfp pilus assembly protein PilN
MSPMIMLLILWGAITLVLVVLLIYRSTLTMHEDDQLFLSEGEHAMQEEQQELIKKMNKLQPLVRACGALSVVLLAVMAGMWIYDAYKHF